MTKYDDATLVKNYSNGDEYALSVLLNRHKQKIFNYINQKVNDYDLAEDLFQDIFIKVILTIKEGKYNEEGKFLPWVLRISHNMIVDYFRIKNRTKIINETCGPVSIFEYINISESSIEDIMINKQVKKDLLSVIDLLPNNQREVLELRFYKGLSFKEIAEKTKVGVNTSLGRMRYALMNIRKIIDEKKHIL